MKKTLLIIVTLFMNAAWALPESYTALLPFVQPAPDQGDTNTCWFVASTGAMELLLNKKDGLINQKAGSVNDLAESFLIFQKKYHDPKNPVRSFIEDAVIDFNWGEAVHHKDWPFVAFNSDGTTNKSVWNKHPDFENLPRMKVPPVETVFLFSYGRKRWATGVLDENDIQKVKEALVKYQSPVIVNYNDDYYWHVILIVGYDDKLKGDCYQIEDKNCNSEGSFYVRDSNGKIFESRAYNWFLENGNAASVVKFK